MPYLKFISDDDFKLCVATVLNKATTAVKKADEKVFSNVLDPFSAIFDSMVNGISLSEWLETEKRRQIQKTLQNALGDFHQSVIGAMQGWENLGTGGIVDVRNKRKKIIAEIKNKYNTTKGSDKKSIYDNLVARLKEPQHRGFTGYYVEVIPKYQIPYDCPFTPSDNIRKQNRQENEHIRIIDGSSFYAMASGEDAALRKLYEALPKVIADLTGNSCEHIKGDDLFTELYDSAY